MSVLHSVAIVLASRSMMTYAYTKEICVKAYSRMSMITKLKYVGVTTEDLIDIYILYIRSITEYCSVVFHSRLTNEDSDKIERIQKTCLKVILGICMWSTRLRKKCADLKH